MRKDVTGEMASGDDSFSIIEQIVSILIGDSEDDSFSVLVSKGGDAIKVPLAVRGRNYIIRSAEPMLGAILEASCGMARITAFSVPTAAGRLFCASQVLIWIV